MNYHPQKIEKKWQRIWQKRGIDQTLDRVKGKKNFYCLDMFPYPSGEGLHVGHLHGYISSDIVARYLRMKGFNVLHPMGFDAFGLPAENAAIKRKIHPKSWTFKNIRQIRKQLKSIGPTYDWEREIITCQPEYYKWTQWLFLQFFKAGLAKRAKVSSNFCPSCKTVLANEQVIEGRCERCNSEVVQKEFSQWLFKITDYAEELLRDLPALDWPEKTRLMQRNWIGKSEGWDIKFSIFNFQFSIEVFTTRVDTLFGCTYLVLAPEHPIIKNLESRIQNLEEVEKYIEETKKKTERERISEVNEKTGIEIKGIKAVNPVNGREIPIFLADYVLIHYGTGAIMAVPSHDQRDFDFARKYNLPMIEVIKPYRKEKELPQTAPLVVSDGRYERAYEGEGYLFNSGRFNGMSSEMAREEIGKWLEKKGQAKRKIYYKLRDWLISRQRYWGVPIPLVFCQNCADKIKNQKSPKESKLPTGQAKIKNFNQGELLNPGWIAVPEKELPVLLPKIKDYLPTGEGKSPLAKSKKFVETTCPKCRAPAKRETDTMDTFVCSSWYYLAYAFWHKIKNLPRSETKFLLRGQKSNKENIFRKWKNIIKAWLPVDLYVGGAEHAVMHLLYARFFTKVLKDLKVINFDEPFLKLRHQGIILGPDGQKMSKSKGNVVPIDETVKKYGADTLRLYGMFMGPFEATTSWDTKGIEGCYRFLKKVWKLATRNSKLKTLNSKKTQNSKLKIQNVDLEKLLHKTIKKVTEDIENFRFNTAISSLMILVNEVSKNPQSLKIENWKLIIKLLAPFAPHLGEELWQRYILKVPSSLHNQVWPKHNPKLVKEEIITLIIQVNGKVRDKIEVEADISEEEAKELTFFREKVKKWIEGKEIKKVIFVPGKLINIVV